MLRSPALPIAVLALLLFGAASANATEYYVSDTGSGTDCTLAQPCATISAALDAHRASPASDDVITVGPGTFVEDVMATDPADAGLTIRGTLSGTARQTIIRSDFTGMSTGCLSNPCAVALGAFGVAVTLRDVNVDTHDADNGITAISLEGGSDLRNDHVETHPGDSVGQIVIACDDPGTVIDHTTIDAASSDPDAEGISFQEGLKISDSHIIVGEAPAVDQSVFAARQPVVLKRTWLEGSAAGFGPLLISEGDLVVDSSLLTGEVFGVLFDGSNGGTWSIADSTIDVGAPGIYDYGSPDLFIVSVDGDPDINIDVNSSLLAEEIQWFQPRESEGGGSITCEYSDIQYVADPSAPADGSGCSLGGTNTTTDPGAQFVGGTPFSWELLSDAPARDAGDPTFPTSLSTHDLLGVARERVGLESNCGSPAIRDMGAYEATAVCVPTLVSSPAIERGGAPVVGVKLGLNPGRWTGPPTSYSYQWIRCDADGVSNCTDIAGKTGSTYTPSSADASHTLRVGVVATNGAGSSSGERSAPSGVVTGAGVPVVSSLPSIRNGASPTIGVKLGARPGTWSASPDSYAFQWIRCDSDGTSNCSDIAGKTTSLYTPGSADATHTLRVRVVATNGDGSSSGAESLPSGVVPAPGAPVVSIAPSIKNGANPTATTKLGAQPGKWSGSPSSYAFQWIRCDSDGTSNCEDIVGKTGSTFTPGAGLVGYTISLRVTATNGAGASAPSTSLASGVVS